MMFATSDRKANATAALAAWERSPDATLFIGGTLGGNPGAYALAVTEGEAKLLETVGWAQTSPEEIEALLSTAQNPKGE